MTLVPSSDGTETLTLTRWNRPFACVPSEGRIEPSEASLGALSARGEGVAFTPEGRKLIAKKRPETDAKGSAETKEGEPKKVNRTGPTFYGRICCATTFDGNALECSKCHRRTRLLAMVTEPENITRFLKGLGEPLEPPARAEAWLYRPRGSREHYTPR